MLNTLLVENFQKHDFVEVEFRPGLNLIVGPNWSGKSTLKRAILYALFGASAIPLSLEKLANPAGPLRVVLEFGNHKVTRTTKTALLVDLSTGKTIASGQGSVTAEIEALLGIGSRSFQAFRVAHQKEAGVLLTYGVGKLSEHINAITGVDVVDRALVNLKALAKVSESWADAYPAVRSTLDTVRAQEASVAQELAEWVAEGVRLAAEVAASQGQLTTLSASYAEALKQRDARARYDVELLRLSSAMERAQATFYALGVPAGSPVDAASVALQRADLDAKKTLLIELRGLIARRGEFVSSLNSLSSQIERNQGQARAFADLLPDLRAEDTRCREVRSTREAERNAVVQAIEGAVCPTCLRPHEGRTAAELDALKARLVGLNEAYVAAEYAVVAAAAELADLQQRVVSSTALDNQLTTLVAQREALQQQLSDVEASLAPRPSPTELELAVETLTAEITQAEQKQRVWQHWESQHALLEEQFKAARETFDVFLSNNPEPAIVDDAQLKDQYAQTVALTNDVQRLTNALSGSRATEAAKRENLDQVRTYLAGTEAQLATVEMQVRRLDQIKALTKYLLDNRDRFVADVWSQLLGYANTFLAQATSGAVTGLLRSPEGEFQFLENGRAYPVAVASGFLEDVLGTGLKLALSAALGGPADFLLFDEISAAGSDENALLLTSLLRQTDQQVVVISHRPADAAIADHVIHL